MNHGTARLPPSLSWNDAKKKLGGSLALPNANLQMTGDEIPSPPPQRKHPAHGLNPTISEPTILFVTVCTKDRCPWLTKNGVHELLREVWSAAQAWIVGRYVLMPDHLHFFATPGKPQLPLENWIRFWKSQFTKRHKDGSCRWQPDHWDRRLRSDENYD